MEKSEEFAFPHFLFLERKPAACEAQGYSFIFPIFEKWSRVVIEVLAGMRKQGVDGTLRTRYGKSRYTLFDYTEMYIVPVCAARVGCLCFLIRRLVYAVRNAASREKAFVVAFKTMIIKKHSVKIRNYDHRKKLIVYNHHLIRSYKMMIIG